MASFFSEDATHPEIPPKPVVKYRPEVVNRWRPEEDAKLIELLAYGKTWSEIGAAMPGRGERSCKAHYHDVTLARKILHNPKTNKIVQKYSRYVSYIRLMTYYDLLKSFLRKRSQFWGGIAKKVSLPWEEVEAIFLYLFRESPDIIKNGGLPRPDERALPGTLRVGRNKRAEARRQAAATPKVDLSCESDSSCDSTN